MPLALSERLPAQPLPEKIATLLHEARWLLVAASALFLGLILWGYERTDPGWSHAVEVESIHNPGGRFGAWLADLLLYLFGLSAWFWVVFLLVLMLRGWRRLGNGRQADAGSWLATVFGFALLLASASALEALRFWSLKATLPLAPGGVLGIELGETIASIFGYLGGTLLLITSFLASLSLFSGISWLTACEAVGGGLERLWLFAGQLIDRWRDRQVGRIEAVKREAAVESERRKQEENPPPPIRIEPTELAIPPAPKAIERMDQERQASLFHDAPGAALPPLHLLDDAKPDASVLPGADTLEFTSRLIERKLADFGVEVKVVSAHPGPVITRYEIEPATGVKGSQIVNLAKDLARALSLISIRVVETVPGKSCMALELPNPRRQTVRLSELIASQAYHDMASPLTVVLGKDIAGGPVVADLAKMPHLLVAGTTGSGKSVGINAMILSLLYKSEAKDVRLIMVDPKMLELSIYEGIPHLLAPVVTDMNKAANALNWCVGEMDRRYKLMSMMGVRNIAGCNKKIREAQQAGTPIPDPTVEVSEAENGAPPLQPLPYIVVIIDELADLMMVVGKKIEELIARLAQKARAAGIHLILATQRPSVDVITGLIKANVPTRIAFQVSSKIDSRTILDQMGAETLLGQGDMLYLAPGTGVPMRVHGAFVADDEVHRVVEYLKKIGPPNYIHEVLAPPPTEAAAGAESGSGEMEADPLYDQAVEIVLKHRRPSISLVQRHLRIGYNRAARMIEAMERAGLVSPANAAGTREVLVPEETA